MITPKIKCLWFCLLLICPFLLKPQNFNPLVVNDSNRLDIPEYADILIDSTFQLTVDSFLQNPQRYIFVAHKEKQVFRPNGAVYWLRFTIRNDDSVQKRRFVVIYKREIDNIELALVNNNHIQSRMRSGATVPYLQRPYPHPHFWLPISLAPQTMYTAYLCLDNRYDVLSTTVFYQAEHLNETVSEEIKNSFMAGFATFYLLFAIGLFVYTRERLFFYYIIYVFGGIGYLVSTCGFGMRVIWQDAPLFDAIADNVLVIVSLIGFILLTRRFFEIPKRFKKADIILRGGIVLCLCVIVATFSKKILIPSVYFYTSIVGGLSFIPIVFTIFYVSLESYRQMRERESGLFLLSFSNYILMGLIVIAAEFGVIKYSGLFFKTFFDGIPAFAFFFEMTIMSILLTYRIKKTRKDQQQQTIVLQQKVIQQRENISRDLHDDVGSTLNSISVYSEIARRQIHETSPQSESILVNIGTSARQLIESMNDIVWAINPDNDRFKNITQRMRMFAAQIMMSQNIVLQFEADERLNDVILSIEKRKNFYLIFKEAVNNVFKYANCKTLTIKIQQQNGFIEMQITDDGCGFDSKTIYNGNGMKTMRHRADELNGTLNVDSEIGKGTILSVRFPVKETV